MLIGRLRWQSQYNRSDIILSPCSINCIGSTEYNLYTLAYNLERQGTPLQIKNLFIKYRSGFEDPKNEEAGLQVIHTHEI